MMPHRSGEEANGVHEADAGADRRKRQGEWNVGVAIDMEEPGARPRSHSSLPAAKRFSSRRFRCSGRLFTKIHRKSLDLSHLRPVNRMASLPP